MASSPIGLLLPRDHRGGGERGEEGGGKERGLLCEWWGVTVRHTR